jgi:hypothetical protein
LYRCGNLRRYHVESGVDCPLGNDRSSKRPEATPWPTATAQIDSQVQIG